MNKISIYCFVRVRAVYHCFSFSYESYLQLCWIHGWQLRRNFIYRVTRGSLNIFDGTVHIPGEWSGAGRVVIHLSRCDHLLISVAMESCAVEYRVFTYELYIRNNDSVVILAFFFNVDRHGAIQTRLRIMNWVRSFRTTSKKTNRCHTT